MKLTYFLDDGVNPLLWSLIEVDLGIMCACIPTVKPLFTRKGTKISSKMSQSRDRFQDGNRGHPSPGKSYSGKNKGGSIDNDSMDSYHGALIWAATEITQHSETSKDSRGGRVTLPVV